MRLQGRHWIGAITASLVLHGAGAAAFLAGSDDAVMVEGGSQVEVAMLGNAFADAVSAGQSGEAVRPVEDTSEIVEPLQPAQGAETIQPTQTVVPETAVQAPVETRMVETAPVAPAAQPVETARAETVPVEPLDPTLPAPSAEAAESETLAPDEPAETDVGATIAALTSVPLPTARPAQPAEDVVSEPQTAPRSQARTVERSTKPAPRAAKPARPKAAGNGGRDQADARRGTADGSAQSRSASSGNAGRSQQAGNAAVSNYPGKVVSKLRRSLRYPSQARRERLRGEVHVAFTVSAGGGVSSIRIVRGSGSPVLDQAAIETVQRAAPFPPIPQGAGRNNWPFTVPLAFTR